MFIRFFQIMHVAFYGAPSAPYKAHNNYGINRYGGRVYKSANSVSKGFRLEKRMAHHAQRRESM